MNAFHALEEASQGAAPHEDGMDSPQGAALDDPRMHVRAWKRWTARRRGACYPSIEDMGRGCFDDPNGVLLSLRGRSEDPEVVSVGSALLLECGARGLVTVSDIPEQSLLARLTGHYPVIMAIGEPMAFEGEHLRPGGGCVLYRGILLPLSRGGESIDFIHGMISCREPADSGMAAAIADEARRFFADRPALAAVRPAGLSSAAFAELPHPELPLSA